VSSLAAVADAPHVTPVAAWSDRAPEDLRQLAERTGLRILPTGRRLTPLLWTLFGRPRIEKFFDRPVDLVHANSLGYPIATKKPFVVTVHDIGPLTHPEFFTDKPPWIMRKSLDQAVRQAAAFICVSHATAKALIEYVDATYRVDLTPRVSVIHEGVSHEFFLPPEPGGLTELNGNFSVDRPFILAVGKISPRKNLDAIIRALDRIRDQSPHHLVLVGGDGWDHETVRRQAGSLGLTDRVHFLGYLSDESLRALYARAAVFVYPSLFEGFGLPVLEAMAAGCPVITSTVSSLPEVAGAAAVLVNPYEVGEIAEALAMLCLDEGQAQRYSDRGVERARTFTWEKCAREVAAIYRSVLS
jgi:glycosyltransferase involved in cell wall biosynthesis